MRMPTRIALLSPPFWSPFTSQKQWCSWHQIVPFLFRCDLTRLHNRRFGSGMSKGTPPRPAKKYACLVDAENTPPSKLSAIIDELEGYGQLVARNLYGDFSRMSLQPWRDASNKLGFRPHIQFAHKSGRGSSDMTMAMDAIFILHDKKHNVDGFVLV